MKKFCPKCGKSILKGSFCNECNPETIDYKPINIKICPSKRVFFQGKWAPFNTFEELSERLARKFIKQEVVVEKPLEFEEEFFAKPGLSKIFFMEVERNGKVFRVPVNIEVTLSPAVSKVGSTYFEGILQLRNATQEVKEYVNNYTKKNGVFINKTVDKGKDVDYFFVKKKQMNPLSLKLMRNFGAKIESNAQLFSYNRQTSKDIFRVNVLVTIPDFCVGDVVEANDSPFLVKETSKIITGVNLITGKKATFRSEDSASIKKLKKQKSKVVMVQPELKALDQETYQMITLKNPLNIGVVQDQNITIVKYKEESYLVK
ncbi:MAG: NMD3-related protein [Candidatus Nanoarchaeia archaeon]